MIVPDGIIPEVGWRAWRPWVSAIASPCFAPPAAMWIPGRRMEAECLRTHFAYEHNGQHEAPAPGCSCGIHATKTLDRIGDYLAYYSGNAILGQVSLWGRVIEGEWGWKAQYAYPLRFFWVDSLVDDLLKWDAPDYARDWAWRRRLYEFGVPVERVWTIDDVRDLTMGVAA